MPVYAVFNNLLQKLFVYRNAVHLPSLILNCSARLIASVNRNTFFNFMPLQIGCCLCTCLGKQYLMPVANNHTSITAWKNNKRLILSLVLAVYSLRRVFYVAPTLWLDGSWIRALNMALKNKLVFGSRFVFTYGPLGFLSTRNTQYISSVLLLAGDLFLAAGFFYLAYQYLSRQKNWFFIILFSLFLFRGAEYSQALFLLFIVYATLNIQNKGNNTFEVVYCACTGVLLFFVKVNYGIFSLLLLPAIAFLFLFRNRRAFALFAGSSALLYLVIWPCVHIDVVNYVRRSLPLIRYYNEAMFFPANVSSPQFIFAVLLIGLFLSVTTWYVLQAVKQKKIGPVPAVKILLLSLVCYLFYKNGYTRADSVHYSNFYSVFPLFFILVIFLFDYGDTAVARIAAGVVTCLSIAALLLSGDEQGAITPSYIKSSILPLDYFAGIFTRQPEDGPIMALPKQTLTTVGNATVDVIPTKVAMAQLNNLKYAPRPIPQSYSAYCPELDSLNADHFYGAERPGFVFIRHGTIDNRYGAWDESLTKATIHLNYDYAGEASVSFNSVYDTHLLFSSKNKAPDYPRFEKISERIIDLDDMVRISFPDSAAVYMTANVEYDVVGAFRGFLFQPPRLQVALVVDSTGMKEFEAIRPAISAPVLINKYIGDNRDLGNFLAGNLKMNKNISAFGFHAPDGGIKSRIMITFLKLANY